MNRDESIKSRIFSILISCEISTYMSTYAPDRGVVPISNIVSLLGNVTKYATRKAIKRLIAEGVVEYTSQGCPAIISYGEVPELVMDAMPPINGYCITKKGFETDEWKQAYNKWVKSMEEWCNGEVESEKQDD